MGKLRPQWKTDYFAKILKYDDKIGQRVADEHAKVLKEHIENLGEQDELTNVKGIWTEGVTKFNELMEQKLNELGYSAETSKHGQKKYALNNPHD